MLNAKVKALQDLTKGILTYEEALEACRPYYNTHGSFHAGAQHQYGIPVAEGHFKYHVYSETQHIESLIGLKEAFKQANDAGILCAVITHSHMHFASRVLNHLGIQNLINPDHIVTLEQVDYREKHTDRAMFEEISRRTNIPEDRTMVLEDTQKNLAIAKNMGESTCYIHWGQPIEPLPPHIDIQFKTPVDALQAVIADRKNFGPHP